jgi:hypothetical protein
MVPSDHALERRELRGDSGGRIAVKRLGGMMSLDPWLCGFSLVAEYAVYAG